MEATPPTIQINNELIFISAELKSQLAQFAANNKIEIVSRPDIWSWILEPFLDTEFTTEHKQKLDSLLSQYGLTSTDVVEIRNRVKKQMLKYNFDTMLWNWIGFSAMDVLFAMRPKLSKEEFQIFYEEVMRIALLTAQQENKMY